MASKNPPKKSIVTCWLVGLVSLVVLAVLYAAFVHPFLLQITDQAGPWYLTFSPADLDLDGDLDVLVHNMRHPAEFEAWAGGTLWINQGGLQGGQAGHFAYRRNDIEGGWASTTADIDGDGDPDALIYDGSRLILGINQGRQQGGQAGVFKERQSVPPPERGVGEYGVLVVGDIDADGRLDALMLGRGQSYVPEDGSYSDNVSWAWLNKVDPDGFFEIKAAFIAALNGLSVAGAALGDLDGDGDLDLFAVASPTGAKSMNGSSGLLLLNDGTGSFSDSGQRFPAENSTSLALGDLDGDGDLDALLGYGRGAGVLVNQGGAQGGKAGQFAASPQAIAGSQTRSVRLADVDGDGDLDALVTGKRRAALWWNDGWANFTRQPQTIPCSGDQDLTVGDFNGDGRMDIFVATYDKASVVWFNDGLGSFRTD